MINSLHKHAERRSYSKVDCSVSSTSGENVISPREAKAADFQINEENFSSANDEDNSESASADYFTGPNAMFMK